MTFDQFESWYQFACRCIPEIANAVNRSSDPQATYQQWAEILAGVAPEVAKGVIIKMMRSEIARPQYGHWSELPGIICDTNHRRLAEHRAATDRERRREERNRGRWVNDGTTETCVEMFERLEREMYGGPPEWCTRYRGRREPQVQEPKEPETSKVIACKLIEGPSDD